MHRTQSNGMTPRHAPGAAYTGAAEEDRLCLALYVAHRKTIARYRSFLDALGLTFTQYMVLVRLWERDRVSVAEVGRELDLDSGTLTPLLKRLEAKGLVDRRRSRSDERVVLISLTARGRELGRRAAQATAQERLAGLFGPGAVGELLKALEGEPATRARSSIERAF
jgi:DNA-binding MarR family transcriptional regulator